MAADRSRKSTTFVVPDGSSLAGIADKLEAEGVVGSASQLSHRVRACWAAGSR